MDREANNEKEKGFVLMTNELGSHGDWREKTVAELLTHWKALSEKLPTKKDAESVAKRKQLWKQEQELGAGLVGN